MTNLDYIPRDVIRLPRKVKKRLYKLGYRIISNNITTLDGITYHFKEKKIIFSLGIIGHIKMFGNGLKPPKILNTWGGSTVLYNSREPIILNDFENAIERMSND